jgi:hypothetical protein
MRILPGRARVHQFYGVAHFGCPGNTAAAVSKCMTNRRFSPLLSDALSLLYGYSIVESDGVLPFGELSHGSRGLRDDLASTLGMEDDLVLLGFVQSLSHEET